MTQRRGIAVAILGPDGAGKSTLVASLVGAFPVEVRTFYAGLYPQGRTRPRWRLPGLGTVALLFGMWRTEFRARRHRARGGIVLYDRYAYDALLPLSTSSRRVARWRRALIVRAAPRPDMVVVLDAPATVLRARRQEQPLEIIEAQRVRYAELAVNLRQAQTVDATMGADAVSRRVTDLIWRRYVAR